MRPPVDEPRIRALAIELGRVARQPVRIYLTGGSTAVLEGWREATIDVDLRFEPEADQLLRALPALEEALGVNIELASPPDFIPELPGWRDRSPHVFREGSIERALRGDRAGGVPLPGDRPVRVPSQARGRARLSGPGDHAETTVVLPSPATGTSAIGRIDLQAHSGLGGC